MPDALIRLPPEPGSPRFGLQSSDAAPASPIAPRADLPELFRQITRLKASLCGDLDARLCSEHGVAFTAFRAVSELSHQREGCDQAALAATLSVAPRDLDALVEALVASGVARRSGPTREGAGPILTLTFRGDVLLRRAGRTVDRELDRRIGSVLSHREIAQMEHALAAMGSALP